VITMPGRRHFVATLIVLACALGSPANALAQRAFLFIPGIPGESTVEGFANWIDVLSIRQSASVSSRKSAACDVAVVKNIDLAGPALWATAASGLPVSEMIIAVLRNAIAEGGAGSPVIVKQYEIKLTNVRITSVQATAGATDSSETVNLQPQSVTLTFFTQTPTGLPGPSVVQSFACQ
jgi:type VI protein secretion system component Hcp